MVYGLRGAVEVNENTREAITDSIDELFSTLTTQNRIRPKHIISVIFSVTSDLTASNPAAALRAAGYDSFPLFCTQEPQYDGSHPRIIRMLILCKKLIHFRPLTPVYIRGAEKLRPDLFLSGQ